MQRSYTHGRPTIGVLAGRSSFRETIHPYWYLLLRALQTAAHDNGCNLLLSCGMEPENSAALFPKRTAWPVLSPDNCFLPVGPWNTDGLLVINPLITETREMQSQYLMQLRASGHPIVFVGKGEQGPTVSVDNEGGIRQAMTHLIAHGHRNIAFIAGLDDLYGDSYCRLLAYNDVVREYHLNNDPHLVAYSNHYLEGGRSAMGQILNAGAYFTAVIASNDESAIGAMQVLQEIGKRVPEDVALVGFDNLIDMIIRAPQLTSVHSPIFEIGYQAFTLLLRYIEGALHTEETILVPTQLALRESCGCLSLHTKIRSNHTLPELTGGTAQAGCARATHRASIVQTMKNAVLVRTRQMFVHDIEIYCQHLVEAFLSSLQQQKSAVFDEVLQEILTHVEKLDDTFDSWQAAISVLHASIEELVQISGQSTALAFAYQIFYRSTCTINERLQNRHRQVLVQQQQMLLLLNRLMARLHRDLNENQLLEILAKDLPELGIPKTRVVFYEAERGDPVAWCRVYVWQEQQLQEKRFPSRTFPPTDLYPAASPFHLILLPLLSQEGTIGFATFDTADVALSALITRQIGAALQNSQLYRMKNRFLSTISHELRTPLNLIVGLSEILLREHNQIQTTLPKQVLADLNCIHTSGQHLGHLIHDVLDLTSSEAGQLRLNCEPLVLEEVLRDVAETGEQLTQEKGLGWQYRIAPALPPVWGDQTRLQQVVLNLISNAVKFTAQGQVTLTAEEVDGKVTVSVSDTGPGTPLLEQNNIFREFHQSERTNNSRYGGLGLGLAICKQLVQLHGGEIGVRSPNIEGIGSTFFFTLPPMTARSMGSRRLSRVPESVNISGQKTQKEKTILIVEDDPDLLELYIRMIEGHGHAYRTLRAQNGYEAMYLLGQVPPDLVLLDLKMPDMNGFAVLDALRQREDTRSIPVIVLTAQILTEKDMQRLHNGVTTILYKGVFREQEILSHIETALSGTRKLGDETQQLVRKAMAYLHTHYSEPISLEQIAQYVSVSEEYLSRCFQREIGIAPISYLNRYRVNQAKMLLAEGGRSVTEVALTAGFSDLNHFRRAFQREVGSAPTVYQRERLQRNV